LRGQSEKVKPEELRKKNNEEYEEYRLEKN